MPGSNTGSNTGAKPGSKPGSVTGLKPPGSNSSVTNVVSSAAGAKRFNVCVLGAAGGIGVHLSLLLKMNPLIKKLALYDVAPTIGHATDLSHINTPAEVVAFSGKDKAKDALRDCQVAVLVAGVTIKPGQTRDDVFGINGGIIKGLMLNAAEVCPKAFIAIVTNPVNSNVPLAVDILKGAGITDAHKRVFGVCTLDLVRACTFGAEKLKVDRNKVNVPVIGGHSGITIIPVLSQSQPPIPMTAAERADFVKQVQDAGFKVLEAKEGKGTATTSMAYSAAQFTNSLLLALAGRNQVECTYVKQEKEETLGVKYFSCPIMISHKGVEKNYGIGNISDYEKGLLAISVAQLKLDIQKGEEYAKK